jgi:dipeptidyl aminopeptidase/acylaminoacyl peptidase
MRFKFGAVFLVLISFGVFGQQVLTVDKIMQDPKWMGTSPSDIYWNTDSKNIYFNWNPGKALLDSVHIYDLENKKIEKIKAAEYKNILPNSGTYSNDRSMKTWAKEGDLFIQIFPKGEIKRLTQTVDIESNPGFSADNQHIIFQKNSDVFTFEIATGFQKQWTDKDKGTKKMPAKKSAEETWLEADQERLFDVVKDRKKLAKAAKKTEKPFAKKIFLDDNRLGNLETSPDLKSMIFTIIETSKSAKNTIVPNYVTASGYIEDIPARNKVGSPQASFTSFLYNIEKDTILKITYKALPGLSVAPLYLKEYLKKDSTLKNYSKKVSFSSFKYSPNGSYLIGIGRSDDNKDRWIVKIDLQTGAATSIDHQHDEAWIGGPGVGFSGTLGFINESQIYFQSEETGYSHLYVFDVKTGKKKALTSGKYEILKAELSQAKDKFFITTNEVHPGEQHFYHLPLSGEPAQRITTLTGAHDVSVSPDEKWLAIRYSYSNRPWELFIQENKINANAEQITQSLTPDFLSYHWQEPKVITFKATDNQDVYARIYEPNKKNKKAVIFVHGAGYLQNAHKWWSNYYHEYMFHNLLVDLGYTVLDIDYRASAGYGRDVRTGIYRHMGGKDLSDNIDGAAYLVKNYGIDKNKIGIYGGSYGGFITLMGLFTAPDVFKAGAALRPVTDWAAYNHGYTANILNTPQTDSLAYARSSPINFANGLKNSLLMCHGVVDVNVHYQDVVRLSQRLIELKKENWDLASYPVEDHGFVEPSSWTDEYKRILKLFEEKLK